MDHPVVEELVPPERRLRDVEVALHQLPQDVFRQPESQSQRQRPPRVRVVRPAQPLHAGEVDAGQEGLLLLSDSLIS